MGRLVRFVAAAAILAVASPAGAETFRLVAPDGTVHFTNAPTDPRYQRLGIAPPALPRPPALAPASVAPAVSPYVREIREAAARYGLPEQLITAVIRVESGFNARAVSPKGARGLMQLMPETASLLGVRDPFDPRENIDAGVRHLRGLIERLADLALALAAYNAGEPAVLAWGGIPPYPETRDYVARVLRLFAGAVTAAREMISGSTFWKLERDGTVVYTNIPPRGRL